MGTESEHRRKADHHLRFLGVIPDEFPDWQATVAFYATVELVECLRAQRNEHSRNHEQRKEAVQRNYPRIKKAYQALYNASLNARYEAQEHWLSLKEVQDILVGIHLNHIKAFAG